MKIKLLLILSALVILVGCTTSQQRIAFNTLYTVEHATTDAYDGYLRLVVTGQLPTNNVPKVSGKYDTFQKSFVVALDAVQYNTNALAPASLQIESQDLINLITNLKGVK